MSVSQISVIGGGQATPEQQRNARTIGKKLAEKGITVICGGGGGVMKAVARGVNETQSGRVIGVRPEEHNQGANEYLDDIIVTGMGLARNVIVVLSGEAVIAVGGKYGTLTEIAYSKKYGKPLFGVGTWKHQDLNFPSDLTPTKAVEKATATLDA